MDSVTSFIYGMSMMFFSMMAFLFWRKGKEMLFRMIMWMVFFLIYGFDNEHAWYLTSSLDMMIIPFYSFVLMELVKPGWFRWVKALMLELPFLLLPVFYILPIISSGFMCFLSGEPFMDALPLYCLSL